ncbi:N-acetylmuramoyl-L-alanine amidase [Jeotgalibacillus malaysiensis]|uniref:N-acetylmuramoyl-L-alanine amidase n=1 Tax=Jeotgalibacillus malaysiensis TaxID=1508404 RepID=A0A0B5AW79_9BACL|nr:cell wall-binding repeat-containing protein [Jeotgalibacillus malaysiensis]AJD92279.1 N-acetylmuramoyl-L-alanine amidase [Jeotgalibacillus malaysiensis]
MRYLKSLVVFLLLFTLVPITSASAETAKNIVVIDPGHGGIYGGTAGYSGSRTGYYEKHANLEVSMKLKAELERRGYEVFMTRTSDTYFARPNSEDLKARTKKSNDYVKGKNDRAIFISVHHNASSSPGFRGYETYYWDKNDGIDPNYPPDPLQVKYSPDSKRLAHAIHGNVLQNAPIPEGRGILSEALYVTRNAQMPSVLLEVGYMSNPTEEALIKQSSFQSKVAVGVSNGVDNFFNTYSVYDHNGVLIATYNNKQQALDFAAKQTNVRVVYDRTNTEVYNNIKRDFAVYHSSMLSFKHYFVSQQEAIKFAEGWRNTRVVDNRNGKVLWSNYLPPKYEVHHASQGLLKKLYDEKSAVDYAAGYANTRVIDKSNSYILWSNYMKKNYQVTHPQKGNLVAFFSKNEAVDYAKKFANTKVVNKTNNKVEFDNTDPNHKYTFNKEEISAENRTLTAIEVSKTLYPNGFSSSSAHKKVILTTAFEYADALSAGPLAAQYSNAPILLSGADTIRPEVIAEMKRLGAQEVVVIGGPDAISESVVNQLKGQGLKTDRISGSTRYETNEKVNQRLTGVKEAMVVSGRNYPDALSAASVAVNRNASIVLLSDNKVDQPTLDYLNAKKVSVIGGDQVVSTSQENQIKTFIGADLVTRLGGETRYETNIAVLNHYNDVLSPKVLVSTGRNFPDALASSSLSKANNAPLLLTGDKMTDGLHEYTQSLGQNAAVEKVKVIGGSVNSQVIDQIVNNMK